MDWARGASGLSVKVAINEGECELVGELEFEVLATDESILVFAKLRSLEDCSKLSSLL